MKTLKTEDLKEIFLVKYYSKDYNGSIQHITETVEDAYDLAEGFLWDKFNLSKEDVVDILTVKRSSDYVELYDESKIDYWNEIHGKRHSDLGRYKYYFTIVRTNIEKIIK